MPFAIDKNPPAIHAEFAVSREERVSRQRVVFDAYEMPIRSISAGTGDYPLRASLIAYYYPSIGELHVEQVSPTFVGKGKSRDEALADFEIRVHSRLQELIWKRPFEIDASDKRDLDVLDRIIDIAVYKNTTPIMVRQFGTVKYDRTSIPRAIKWDNGYTEHVSLNQVASPDFVRYAPEQPVEAWVLRDPLTRKLLRIASITKVAKMRTQSEIIESGFLKRIGSADDLPNGEW